jgi:hypothetical protein
MRGTPVRSIRRRGASTSGSDVRSRRSLRLLTALVVVAIASLGFAVSAFAGAGVTGTNTSGANDLITTPDTTPAGYTQPTGYVAPANDGLGVPAGAIKHVWVIIMENHAYESSFTGLNDNSYLAKTLPSDGALLTNYYGTGHSSLDNYTSMVSGQGPVTDDQQDCPAYNGMSGTVDTSGGSLAANPNYGQFTSAAGPNAPSGDNGCVYPSSVPTLFNQLDANSTTWKVYAQDLAATPVTGQNAGTGDCGAPEGTLGPTPSPSQTSNPGASGSPYYVAGSANATDQYVAKHNPLPWFSSDLPSSLSGSSSNNTDCASSTHLGPVLGPNDQLLSDLQSESTTPAMNFIIPDNCNNAHDSQCVGNNLSGGFGTGANSQIPNSPINNVGGSYAGDQFLGHVIPEIMQSPAYSDGGLIAVVFDEAYPQFTYSADSLANSTTSDATAYNSLLNDEAGQTLFGRSLNWEPSGPNVPNVQNQFGQQLSAGPGFNEYLDRPNASAASPLQACSSGQPYTSTSGTTTPGYNTITNNGCYLGGGTSGAGGQELASFTAAAGTAGGMITQTITSTSTSAERSLVAPDDEGQAVTPPTGVTFTENGAQFAGPVYIGQVVTAPPAAISQTGTDTTPADQGPVASFQLVDANGNPVGLSSPSGSYAGTYTLSGDTTANDPFYDAFDGTTGGGDTGAVLLSPYIKGGTVSNNYYNHYSLLRTLEDFFQTSKGTGTAAGYTGPINVSTGVDGAGHLGYAAQPGLDPFGTDVFTNSPLLASTPTTVTSTVTTPAPAAKTVTSTVTSTVPGSLPYGVTVPGQTITVTRNYTFVPPVRGKSLADAEALLKAAGLKVGTIKGAKAKRGYTQYVSAQSLSTGAKEARTTVDSLTVVLKKDK